MDKSKLGDMAFCWLNIQYFGAQLATSSGWGALLGQGRSKLQASSPAWSIRLRVGSADVPTALPKEIAPRCGLATDLELGVISGVSKGVSN